jgi:hypothetical protein
MMPFSYFKRKDSVGRNSILLLVNANLIASGEGFPDERFSS